MSDPIFLIGAGFNVDASHEGQSFTVKCFYPLASNLAKACFGLEQLPVNRSIEELFQEALDQGNRKPVEVLCDMLIEADNYVGKALSTENEIDDNSYLRFLRRFKNSHFLTFNYDSLLEILLFQMRRWRPDDGYGVAVEAMLPPNSKRFDLPKATRNLILHLHGSLCLYCVEHYLKDEPGSQIKWLIGLDKPEYVFDPDSIVHRFSPFERVPPGLLYQHLNERVIAPIPNKAEGLKGSFVKEVYKQAVELLCETDLFICIGYKFSQFDRSSCQPLLEAISRDSTRVVVVAPDAEEIVSRLSTEFRLQLEPIPITFSKWVEMGFPGSG